MAAIAPKDTFNPYSIREFDRALSRREPPQSSPRSPPQHQSVDSPYFSLTPQMLQNIENYPDIICLSIVHLKVISQIGLQSLAKSNVRTISLSAALKKMKKPSRYPLLQISVMNRYYQSFLKQFCNNLTNLVKLDLSNNELRDFHVTDLVNLKFLKTLTLSNNLLQNIDFSSYRSLNQLNICNNNLTAYSLDSILVNQSIRNINISQMIIPENFYMRLLETNIVALITAHTNLSLAAFDMLSKNPRLIYCDISGNNLHTKHIETIISKNNTLIFLKNRKTEEPLRKIAKYTLIKTINVAMISSILKNRKYLPDKKQFLSSIHIIKTFIGKTPFFDSF